jgi:SAM-dependent methyltransferase
MVSKNTTGEKDHVYKTYDKIAHWFDEHRSRDLFEESYLEIAIAVMPPHGKVLDLGCGMGEPIAEYFIKQGFELTGIDGSQKMIDLAKTRFPTTKFLVGDMRTTHLSEKFDCVIAWHSFFHLPQEDQRNMFAIFEEHSKVGATLFFTSGPEAGELWSENGGEDLYHASLSVDEYHQLLAAHHFELLTYKIEDPECGGATVWVAQYAA